jgi:restriction system protein
LLAQIKNRTPGFFEQLVLDLLVKMGYGGNREDAAMVTKISHDGGIDGIIKEDRLGLDMIYIQAKRWENTVQKPEIQKFRGALSERGATKGIFITTSDFSSGAKESAQNAKIVLIDGIELCRLMIEFGVGVSIKTVYEIKRLDTDYFNSEL